MILEKRVRVKVGTITQKYYTKLGFICHVGDFILVPTEKLSHKSDTVLKCKCDRCGKLYKEKQRILTSPECPNSTKFCRSHRIEEANKLKSKNYQKLSFEQKDQFSKKVSKGLKKWLKTNSFPKRYNTSSFFEKCSKKHKNKFDYSKTKYEGFSKKISLICPIHGEFFQKAYAHVRGNGCPKCAVESKKEFQLGGYHQGYFSTYPKMKKRKATLYQLEMKDNNEKFYKIGITAKTIQARFSGKLCPYQIKILNEIKGSLYPLWKKEQNLIFKNFTKHYRPLQKFSGSRRECFSAPIAL